MTAHVSYPTFDIGACDELKASAHELTKALWENYQHASKFFMANPTPERWRAFVRAHAAWKVAFITEDDGS